MQLRMKTIPASVARTTLFQLLENRDTQPVRITSRKGNAVIIAEEDWDALQETLYLLGIPGMRKSIRDGMQTPEHTLKEEVVWGNGESFSPNKLKKTPKK